MTEPDKVVDETTGEFVDADPIERGRAGVDQATEKRWLSNRRSMT